jgi:hypothetical protein
LFQIIVKLKGEFVGDGGESQRELCSNLVAVDGRSFRFISSLQCPSGSTAVELKSATMTESGNKCSENMELINTVSGNQQCGMIF